MIPSSFTHFPCYSRKAITGIEIDLGFFLCSTALTAVTGPVQCAHPFTCIFELLWVIRSLLTLSDAQIGFSQGSTSLWLTREICCYQHGFSPAICPVGTSVLSALICTGCQFSVQLLFFPREYPSISGHTPSVFPLLPILVSFLDLIEITHSFFLLQNSPPFSTLLTWMDNMMSFGAHVF